MVGKLVFYNKYELTLEIISGFLQYQFVCVNSFIKCWRWWFLQQYKFVCVNFFIKCWRWQVVDDFVSYKKHIIYTAIYLDLLLQEEFH